MTNEIAALLQECLAAYEAGLSPVECLSAFPEHRDELEPLLRQALNLRVAFARAPSEAFSARLRERVMFAAGREATQAYAAEPSEDFVDSARMRLLSAAGAEAQEYLRAVAPPRLPFWATARRRLLEAANQPRQPRMPVGLALRNGFSAAAVALAITVAIVAYLGPANRPTSASADLDAIVAQLDQIDRQTAAGEPVQPAVIVELTKKTNELVAKLNAAPAPTTAPIADRLPQIIERQKDVISQAVTDSGTVASPDLQQAQVQLSQAEAQVRVLAARADLPTVSVQPTTAAAVAPPIPTGVPPTATPPVKPTVAVSPTLVPTPAPVGPGQVRISLATSDTTFGLSWTEVRLSDLHFVIPSTWSIIGLSISATGVAVLDSNHLRFDGPDVIVIVNTTTGEVDAIVNGATVVLLRSAAGKVIDVEDLNAATSASAPDLRHFLDSFDITLPPTPTPSPTPTNTPVVTPSLTPSATNTPSPSPTPSRTPTPPPTATP